MWLSRLRGANSMTPSQERQFKQMYHALKRIIAYDSPDRLERISEKKYGLDYQEALSMAYTNLQDEAKQGLWGVRLPKPPKASVVATVADPPAESRTP
jgi:hypothetical protein